MHPSFRHIVLLLGALIFSVMASAEVVYLKSGQKIEGTLVFQNDQVVVLKDATGARYQYMMTDVDHIAAAVEPEALTEEKKTETKERKVAVAIQLAGGVAILPQEKAVDNTSSAQNQVGGTFQADVTVGTANLLDRQILLGGAFGYHADFLQGTAYSFLPIQLRAEVPLMQTQHAPLVAVGVGYGISANKSVRGGLYAGLDFGWRCRLQSGRAIFLGAFTNMQNARLSVTESLDGTDYTGEANRTFVHAGIKFGLYL